jgi:molybdenum cofactor cytidylyltransferase
MIYGILLAAGYSRRFGSNKLLYPLPDGTPIGVASARNLSEGMQNVIAAVNKDDAIFTSLMHSESFNTVVVQESERGLSASLISGIKSTETADGWVILPADMPWVKPDTINKIAELIDHGVDIAAPYFNGQYGHPIGISCKYLSDLLSLSGEQGADHILQTHLDKVAILKSDDKSVLLDINKPRDIFARQYILELA